MKKITLYLILLCFSTSSLFGCVSQGVSKAQYDKVVAERDSLLKQLGQSVNNTIEDNNEISESKSKFEFDEATVISQLEIKEYQYTDSLNSPWLFLVIKNNSEFNLDINIDLKTFDSNGNLLAAKSEDQEAFESKSEIIVSFLLDEKPSKIEYNISAEEEDFYQCVASELSYKSNSAKDKEIISVTNNGNESADFVQGDILFLKNGVVVDYSYTYFSDDDFEIKPGKTISKELTCYENYDSFIFCLTGRR